MVYMWIYFSAIVYLPEIGDAMLLCKLPKIACGATASSGRCPIASGHFHHDPPKSASMVKVSREKCDIPRA